MLKKFLCLLMAISMFFLFSACKSGKGADAYLVFPIDTDPGYLDPQIISDKGAKNIIANCFEGLVSIDENGAIIPGCAEKWEISPDGLTYTFHLRKDLKWAVMNASSDFLGEDFKKTFDSSLTAEDFVFGIRRALMPETQSPGAKNLLSIENASMVNSGKLPPESLGITAKDKHTLSITLTMADPDFLYILLEPECMPCDQVFFEKTGGRYGLSTRFLMYNGPFYLSNWADDTGFTLYRNDDYYDFKQVKPSTVYISVNGDIDSRITKIKDETYDLAVLNHEQKLELEKNKHYSVKIFDSGVYAMAFNCENTALSNLNIRKAIAASLNKNLLQTYLGQSDSKGIIPSSMLISGNKYRDAAGEIKLEIAEDPKALLKKGLDELKEDGIDLKILCTPEQENAVRHIMQSWQATLGLSCSFSVETATQNEINRRTQENDNWQIAFTSISFPNLTAFNGLLQFTTDNASNIFNFSDKQYDNLVSNIKDTAGQSDTLEATVAAEKYLVSMCPIIPLYSHPVYYGIGKGVEGIIFNSTGDVVYFKNTTVK